MSAFWRPAVYCPGHAGSRATGRSVLFREAAGCGGRRQRSLRDPHARWPPSRRGVRGRPGAVRRGRSHGRGVGDGQPGRAGVGRPERRGAGLRLFGADGAAPAASLRGGRIGRAGSYERVSEGSRPSTDGAPAVGSALEIGRVVQSRGSPPARGQREGGAQASPRDGLGGRRAGAGASAAGDECGPKPVRFSGGGGRAGPAGANADAVAR